MGEVIQLWSLDELERLAREAVQRAWKTRASDDYDRADRIFAQWNRLRRKSKDGTVVEPPRSDGSG
ncbi:MAG: hypothetical protein LDL33_15035 [Desulfomonile sp.]|nr:hypothetical protein [Desulfomonile sp.]